MKPHRIFIAVNLPEDAKIELLGCQTKWPEVPARWTTEENLHLTLAFLGNTSDEELAEVYRLMQEVGKRRQPFSAVFTKIIYGPMKTTPRMIWVVAERTPELLDIQKDVEKTLADSKQLYYQAEKRPYSPHLTLARLKTFELQRMELEEIPAIDESISITFDVNSIEIMESKLHRSGAEYTILQSFMLKG